MPLLNEQKKPKMTEWGDHNYHLFRYFITSESERESGKEQMSQNENLFL